LQFDTTLPCRPTPNKFVRFSTRLEQNCFLHLTRRANQGHIDIIANIVQPAPGNRQRVFHFVRSYRQRQFQVVEVVSLHFLLLVYDLEKNLTRRANHRHNGIIAEIIRPARRNPPRAFLLEFSNRTAAARHDAAPPRPSPERRQRAAVRAFRLQRFN
jgi:hypothetical protein